MGTTFARRQSSGTSLVLFETSKMAHRDGATTLESLRSTNAGIPSVPGAFRTFNFSNILTMPSVEMWMSDMES